MCGKDKGHLQCQIGTATLVRTERPLFITKRALLVLSKKFVGGSKSQHFAEIVSKKYIQI